MTAARGHRSASLVSEAQQLREGGTVADTNQQWDIVTSVGLTALGVAAARAVETDRDGALVE